MRNNYADCDAEGKLNIVNNLTPSAVEVLAAADPDNAWVLDWIEISVSSTSAADFQIFYLDASGVEHSVYKVKVYAGASGVSGTNLFRDFSGAPIYRPGFPKNEDLKIRMTNGNSAIVTVRYR